MKTLALLLLCSPVLAQTFDYQGSMMTGTMMSLQTGATSIDQNPITGFLSAEIVVQGTSLLSYSAEFHASNGTVIPLDTPSGFAIDLWNQGMVKTSLSGNSIALTSDQGQVDGAIFNFNDSIYHNSNLQLTLGSTDTFSYLTDWAGSDGTCQNQSLPYTGPNVTCAVTATGTKGTWMVAPEIEPVGGVGAFLLLGFGLAVIRGRS